MRSIYKICLIFSLAISWPSHAGIFSKRPWCDGWLSREPREIKVFWDDLAEARKTLIRDLDTSELPLFKTAVNKDYASTFVIAVKAVFRQSRYAALTPEIRARLISYLLVKVVRIQTDRDAVVVAMSNWLVEVLNEVKDFSVEDLKRLSLSYQIFLSRRARIIDRANPAMELLNIGTDLGASAILEEGLFHGLAAHLIPGMAFVPIPLFTIVRATYLTGYRYRRWGAALGESTLAATRSVNQKFLELLAPQLTAQEFIKNWDSGLRQTLKSNGTEYQTDGLLKFSLDFCDLAKHNAQQGDVIRILTHMGESLSVVNPIDWTSVRAAFALIRQTAREAGIAEGDAQPIFIAMRKVSNSWDANAGARKSVDDLLNTSYRPQALPDQSPGDK